MPELSSNELSDMMLDPIIDSARRVVSMFFDTNGNYFQGIVSSTASFTPGSLEESFFKLLKRDGPAGYDDRKSAIEIQINQVISLKDQLLFVVLPREFLEDEPVRDAIINVWNCDPVTYSTVYGDAPVSYYSVIREKVYTKFQEATRI